MTSEIEAFTTGIGVRIRAARKSARLSQEALADSAKVATSYLSQIENGKRNPSIKALFHIAKALSVHPRELIPI